MVGPIKRITSARVSEGEFVVKGRFEPRREYRESPEGGGRNSTAGARASLTLNLQATRGWYAIKAGARNERHCDYLGTRVAALFAFHAPPSPNVIKAQTSARTRLPLPVRGHRRTEGRVPLGHLDSPPALQGRRPHARGHLLQPAGVHHRRRRSRDELHALPGRPSSRHRVPDRGRRTEGG